MRRFALALLLLLLALEYLACSGHYHVGHTGDDVMYLSSGRALARGLGYVDLHFPGHPPHMKYPPGYPLLISLGERIWPESLTAQRGLTVVVTLATTGLVWVMLAGLPSGYRWAGTVLTGSNVMWAQFATTVDSGPLYALLLAVAVLLFERGARLALGLTVAAAVYVRTVGVVLFPAVGLAALTERRLWVSLAVAFLLLAPFYLSPARLNEYGRAGMTKPLFGEHILVNDRHLELNLKLPLILWGNPWTLSNAGWAWGALGLAGWALLFRGALVCARGPRGARLAVCLAGGTVAMHGLYAYFDFRYYVPVLPYFYWVLLEGCRALQSRALTGVVVGSLLLGNLYFVTADARRTLTAPEQPRLAATYRWLAAHREPGDIIGAEDPEVWLYTGLPVVYVNTVQARERPDDWLQSMQRKGVTLVLLQTTDPFCEFLARHATPVHFEGGEGTVVFRRPSP